MPFKEALSGVAGDLAGTALAARFNAREASKNRDFQSLMASTQYTRAVADMRRAGLNPILALGNPATAPSGAVASINSPRLGQSGVAAASAKQAIEQQKADIKLKGAQEDLLREQARNASAEADKQEVIKNFYTEFGPLIKEGIGALADTVTNAKEGASIPNLGDVIEDMYNNSATKRGVDSISDFFQKLGDDNGRLKGKTRQEKRRLPRR